MKLNTLTLIVLVLTVPLICSAQATKFGIKAGINRSTLDNEGSDFEMFEARTGFRAGVHALFNLKDKWNLRAELLYSNDGANFKDTDLYLKLNQLSLPLLVNYAFTNSVSLELGPEFNYIIHEDSKWFLDEPSLSKKFDYGVALGIEVKPVSSLGVSLRNYFGFRYHDEFTSRDINNNLTDRLKIARSNVLSLSLNYYFIQ
ncbi:porin family protein [Chryseosolibacter indicus]|uniref:Outer membrane beta-barrel protein n=1 Tax=Chryseosolibacter indicus TaxID=2782351 RepID=A0ABS5VRP5_9BACT|nr:porin family protein [Chryseosolibacter indicus]MBT1704110.1 outer membrane beta-barrel protein [Chryseosolibacter indicus]